jgi:hypothetical protein
MAKVIVSDIEAEMNSLLNQLAELNGCSLEDELCEVLRWAAEDGEEEAPGPAPGNGERNARLLINQKAGRFKTS